MHSEKIHPLDKDIVSSSETARKRNFCSSLAVIFIQFFKEDDAMARKKRLKMPNGFGSIKMLGKNRRNPYGVYPPAERDENGKLFTPKAIGYAETWEEAYELLTVYNMEKKGKIRTTTGTFIDRSPTFAEVFEDFYKEKYVTNKSKTFSEQSKRSTKSAFKNCSVLHDMQVGQIKYKDLQDVLNNCTLQHASQELIASLFRQMYTYMLKYDIVDTDYSAHVTIPIPDDDEQGEPFTYEELNILWKNRNDEVVQMILIMCYSGFRISAYKNMEINLTKKYFKGGVKTKSSKKRTVPIHPLIYDYVCNRDINNLLGCSDQTFRNKMYKKLESLGIGYTADGKKHTPHDCRHTFSTLCEHFKVEENDRKRLLGHSFGSDITNKIYGHRTLAELRKEIEKIKSPEEIEDSEQFKICC